MLFAFSEPNYVAFSQVKRKVAKVVVPSLKVARNLLNLGLQQNQGQHQLHQNKEFLT